MIRRGFGLVSLATCLLVGCGGSAATQDEGKKGPPPMPMNTSPWPLNATELIAIDSGGGFQPPAPAGSQCQPSGAMTYQLAVAGPLLTWDGCASATDGDGGNQLVHGERDVNQSEYDTVTNALAQLRLSTATDCGADKSEEKLQILTPDGEQDYFDSFYACENEGAYVDNIDGVFAALRALAQ